MRIRRVALSCICWLVWMSLLVAGPAAATSPKENVASRPLLKEGNARVILIGDSITGQSRNHPAGFAHQIDRALKEAYPGCHPNVVSLGGSGAGINAWLDFERRSREKPVFLDVKGLDVKEELARPADVVVIMLGMNDILAPYVNETPAVIERWAGQYRKLIHAVRERNKPGVMALATITPCTEDLDGPKNRVRQMLNRRLSELATEEKCLLIATGGEVERTLRDGRRLRSDFHVTHDFVHPNEAGHLAIAKAMLLGMGETAAAEKIQARLLAITNKDGKAVEKDVTISSPWLVAVGLAQPFWPNGKFDSTKANTPIDDALRQCRSPIDVAMPPDGKPLQWRRWLPSVNYTGRNTPGSVDFAGVTFFENFQVGYGVQWIFSPKDRSANVACSTQTFAGEMFLTLFVNGKEVYASQLTKEPGKRKTVEVQLHKGWNMLAFKSNHCTWQWQCTVTLMPCNGDALDDLRYSTVPQEAK